MTDKLEKMKIGGSKLAGILGKLVSQVQAGTNLLQIEASAWKLIEKAGGYPSFAAVPGYTWATCLNVNDGLVHGIPFDYKLKDGDLLNIDIGLLYKGFHTDCAVSFLIGNPEKYPEKKKFLHVGLTTLEKAIAKAVAGNTVEAISTTIQKNIESAGYNCSRKYTGHGIGENLHLSPSIPCVTMPVDKSTRLSYDMTIAIEVIYMMGTANTKVMADGWTVKTTDGQSAAVFEKTVIVGKKPTILTQW